MFSLKSFYSSSHIIKFYINHILSRKFFIIKYSEYYSQHTENRRVTWTGSFFHQITAWRCFSLVLRNSIPDITKCLHKYIKNAWISSEKKGNLKTESLTGWITFRNENNNKKLDYKQPGWANKESRQMLEIMHVIRNMGKYAYSMY